MWSVYKCVRPLSGTIHVLRVVSYHTQPVCMAGHNKWSKIKRPKAIADHKRSKETAKLCAEIRSAVILGGERSNARLAAVVARARSANVPKATIEKAIQSGARYCSASDIHTYGARGPSGYAMIIEAEISNKDETKGSLQRLLKQHGGVLSELKTVLFHFDPEGIVIVSKESLKEDSDLIEVAIEIGADDVEANEEGVCFYCDHNKIQLVKTAAEKKELLVTDSYINYIPTTTITLSTQALGSAKELLSKLRKHPQVVKVQDNINYDFMSNVK